MTGRRFKLDGCLSEPKAPTIPRMNRLCSRNFRNVFSAFRSISRKSEPPGTTRVVEMELITA